MMLERGVTVFHETIRQWTGKFGQAYANGLRRHQVLPHAAHGAGVCAAGAGHQQAGQLRRGTTPADDRGGATPIEVSEHRAENSHQPTRQHERAMTRFTSAGHAQRFLSASTNKLTMPTPAPST